MEDSQFRERESEDQKSLPFNFGAPRLQLTQNKSLCRLPHSVADLILDFAGEAMWQHGTPISTAFAQHYRQRQSSCARQFQEDLAILRELDAEWEFEERLRQDTMEIERQRLLGPRFWLDDNWLDDNLKL